MSLSCNGDSTTNVKTWTDLSGNIPTTQLPGGTPTGSGPVVMATSPVLTTPTLQASPAVGDNSLAVASTAWVKAQGYATSGGTVAAVNLTAQTGTLTNQTLLAAGAVQTGMYRLSGWTKKTTAATTSSTSGPLTLTYTTGTDSVSITPTIAMMATSGVVATSNANNVTTVTGTNTFVEYTFFAKAGVAITYSFTYASSGATVMVYELHLRLEFLG